MKLKEILDAPWLYQLKLENVNIDQCRFYKNHSYINIDTSYCWGEDIIYMVLPGSVNTLTKTMVPVCILCTFPSKTRKSMSISYKETALNIKDLQYMNEITPEDFIIMGQRMFNYSYYQYF